jgi:uncharacterized DUF497 family protein
MRILWDRKKSQALKANPERRTSFEEAKILLQDDERTLGGGLKSYDPEQHYAIGFAANSALISLVYEFRNDDLGVYIWLITLWKTTNAEKKRAGL